MRSEVPVTPSLNAALLAARASVQALVFKANMHQMGSRDGYKYVSHENVLIHARRALLDSGLVLEQRSVEYKSELLIPGREGPRPVWNWRGEFTLTHARTGEERVYVFSATTQPNDKAAYVASTSLDKVAYMRVLALAGTSDENAESDWHDVAPGGVYEGQALPTPRPAPQRAQRTNVVDIRQKPQGLSQQLEWSVGLKTFALEVDRVRDPHALIAWWVKFKVETAAKLEPGLVSECWQMFSAHVRKLDLDLRAIAAECDNQVKAMRATKGGV